MTMNHAQTCSVCHQSFVPEFSYQVEYLTPLQPGDAATPESVFYCSLDCIGRNHTAEQRVVCDVCKTPFSVELVSQVINHGGRRYHACSSECRGTVLRMVQGSPRQELSKPAVEMSSNAPGNSVIRESAAASGSSATTWQRISAEQSGAPRVLAVFNHKGGTAKTTTSLTLAAGLASCDRRVLLVDTDAQGNIGVSLDLHFEKSLYHVLVTGQRPTDVIINARPNLDILPSNETLAAAELYLAGRQRRDRVLASLLNSLRESYDHIIVDCSPSLSLMNQNALVFADALLCPVACDYLSLVAVRQVLRTIKQVNRVLNHPVRLWGVLPTLFDSRARVCTEALATLRQHFGDRCLEPIRVASRVKEAPSVGRTLFEHAGDTTAAKDYLRVVARLLSEAECSESLSQPEERFAS